MFTAVVEAVHRTGPAYRRTRTGTRTMTPLHWRMTLLGLKRPWLLPAIVGAAWAFRARGWWRRPPFLPLPPRSYLRWRMETAYGRADAAPSEAELARYLRWAAEMRSRM